MIRAADLDVGVTPVGLGTQGGLDKDRHCTASPMEATASSGTAPVDGNARMMMARTTASSGVHGSVDLLHLKLKRGHQRLRTVTAVLRSQKGAAGTH